MTVLRGRRRVAVRRRRPRARRDGPEVPRALGVAGEASGSVCSERLQPFLPELVPLLEPHQDLCIDAATRDRLLHASASTGERARAPPRTHRVGRRLAQTKPGTLLRRQIPALVGSGQAEDVPGPLEIDLVSHSGEDAAGTVLSPLSTVDRATGGTERMAVRGTGQQGVVAGLDRIRTQLPFRLRGLHPDTGSAFITCHLVASCPARGSEFTRSRPSHQNDPGHVEQKTWTLVRRLIGDDRLDTPAQRAGLEAFSTEDLRPFAHGFQPVMTRVGTETVGPRTRRLDDTPTTPRRRLLNGSASHVDLNRRRALTDLDTAASPPTLKRRIDRRLAALPVPLGAHASA